MMNSHRKKMLPPIVVSVIIILYYVVYFGILITLLEGIWKYVLGIIPLIFSAVSTTMNIYAHATREAKRNSVRLLDKVAGND